VLFARLEEHDIAGPDFFDRTAFALHPSKAGCHDQRLSQRVGVPRRPGSRLEGHRACSGATGVIRGEEGIDADCPGKPFSGAFGGRLAAVACDLHEVSFPASLRAVERWPYFSQESIILN
jgi:hypothetical protein